MKLSCPVIRDLLPLYHDDICSPESRTMVESHLAECPACNALLEKISEELDAPTAGAEEAQPLRAIQAEWKRSKMRAFIKGTLIAVLICAILAGGFIGLTQWRIIPVSPDVLEISDVCRLSDGSVAFHLNVNDNKNLRFIKFTTTENGIFYMTPMRAVLEGQRSSDFGAFNQSFIFHPAEGDGGMQYNSASMELPAGVTAVYVGPVGDGTLIWEEGVSLPKASTELESILLNF